MDPGMVVICGQANARRKLRVGGQSIYGHPPDQGGVAWMERQGRRRGTWEAPCAVPEGAQRAPLGLGGHAYPEGT